jgi:glycerol transport system ATP-binding protein
MPIRHDRRTTHRAHDGNETLGCSGNVEMGIRVENISKFHEGRRVLDDVSFEVQDGSFVTILAPTGEGKTTLLRIIAGIERPDAGRVWYDGVDVTRTPVQQRSVAMVYQWFVNYPSMTVYDNIASPLRTQRPRLSVEVIDRKVRATAKLLRIESHLSKRPAELSGGQQQRLAIARALAKDADYIFLDEPLTNLDYKLQEELRAELLDIFQQRRRGAVIYATPQPVEALVLSSHVGFMKRGRLLQYGPLQQVYRNPCCRDVGSYFSHPTMNMFEAHRVASNGRCVLRVTNELQVDVTGLADNLSGDRYLLGIRSHALHVTADDAAMVPVPARVELAEVVGSDTELHLSHHGIPMVAWMQGVGHFELGAQITVYVHPRRFYIFDGVTGRLAAKTHQG